MLMERRMHRRTETCTPKSPMLKQVRQKCTLFFIALNKKDYQVNIFLISPKKKKKYIVGPH